MNYSENPTPVYQNPIPPMYKRDSSLAVASLVCGLAAWCVFPVLGAIAAVITGHLAKKEIRESAGSLSGDGMAIAGLILGYTQIGFVILAIFCVATLIVAGVSGVDTKSLVGPSASLLRLMI
jgi:hypothetical protein